jgi:hypothetical protein
VAFACLPSGNPHTGAKLCFLADILESQFEVVDGQVKNLCSLVGVHPSELGSNLPVLNLWTNAVKLVDEVADTQES